MGMPVMIMGESCSGKTYSVKYMDPEKVGIFLCEKNRLPFRKKFPVFKVREIRQPDGSVVRQGGVIQSVMSRSDKKCFIVDDSQYIMANEFFDRAMEKGYDKFTAIGMNFRNLIHFVNNSLPDDVIVYFLHHIETDSNTGKVKAKTIGKMLDSVLTLEGCFDIVIRVKTDGDQRWFAYESDGSDTAKSPEEMFASEDGRIPNNLAYVDNCIREYYGMEILFPDVTVDPLRKQEPDPQLGFRV